jgi:hypothetical protein
MVSIMELLGQLNWQELFVPKHSIVEMLVRGTIMYLALFLILRFVARRQFGQLEIAVFLLARAKLARPHKRAAVGLPCVGSASIKDG